MRILLNEDDFKALTGGQIIEKNGVRIALSDIGFSEMMDIINGHVFNLFEEKKKDILKGKKN